MISEKYQFADFEYLYVGSLNFDSWGNIRESSSCIRNRSSMNKMACFADKAKVELPHYVIQDNTSWYINAGEKIWVAPKCRVPRDVFRNSGYHLVRNIEDANTIIIPEINNDYLVYYGNLIVSDPARKAVCIYTVNRNEGTRQPAYYKDLNGDFEALKKKFEYRDATILTADFDKKIAVELLPKVEEWKALLTNQYPARKYMMELTVPVEYPVEISVETLSLWKRANDMNMLAKAIVASNWKEYPATLLYLLTTEKDTIHNYGGPQMKLVLDQIHYDKYGDPDDILKDEIIQPKDWNMLQAFIMAELGLPENGGFISKDTYRDNDYTGLIQKRYAVKPLYIKEPMLFDNLIATAEKS